MGLQTNWIILFEKLLTSGGVGHFNIQKQKHEKTFGLPHSPAWNIAATFWSSQHPDNPAPASRRRPNTHASSPKSLDSPGKSASKKKIRASIRSESHQPNHQVEALGILRRTHESFWTPPQSLFRMRQAGLACYLSALHWLDWPKYRVVS